MPSDAWPSSPERPHKSLEFLKETFKQKLGGILNKQLNVENIETFADEALNEAIELIDDVLSQYHKNPNFHARPTTSNTQEQENDAFRILELPNIQEVLKRINEVKSKIDELKNYLNSNTEKITTIITPPIEDRGAKIETGAGTFSKKEIFPRLLTLAYILEQDFEILPAEVKITEGAVTRDMMRKSPYIRVEIPELERVVYICEEEDNASYVFDTKKLSEVGLKLEEIDLDDKRDKTVLIAYHPGIGIKIIQTKNWRSRISEVLREPIPEKMTVVKEEIEDEERQVISEFRERKPHNFWTNISTAELIEEIKLSGLDPTNLPNQKLISKANSILPHILSRKFGSLAEARVALGGEVLKQANGYWKNLSLDQVKDTVRERGLDPENLPSYSYLRKENTDLIAGLQDRFGTLNEARKQMGSKQLERAKNFWKTVSIEEIKELIREEGLDPENLPSQNDLQETHSDLTTGLGRRFGGIEKARLALGGKLLKRPSGFWLTAPIEDIRKEIEKNGLDPDNMPYSSTLRKNNGDILQGLTRRFGGYSDVKEGLRTKNQNEPDPTKNPAP